MNAPETYAVLLRGVNVNGTTMKMAELRSALGELPVAGVRTVLASGNVVCTSGLPPAGLKAAVEEKLRDTFGYDAWVILLPAARMAELAAACPYPPDDPAVHAYITFGSDPRLLDELFDAAAAAGAEQTRLGPEAVAWPAPKGGTLDSVLGRIGAQARYKSTTTTRNLRTLQKIADAARG